MVTNWERDFNPTTAADVAAFLGYKGQPSNGNWMVKCPVHPPRPDQKHSLSIKDGKDGGLLLNCFSRKCPAKEIFAAIKAAGMTIRQRWQHGQDNYSYRWDKPGQGKDVALTKDAPITGLPLLLMGDTPNALICVVEGEQDAGAIAAADLEGIASACWIGGAGNAGNVDYSPVAGRKVCIWPDGDDAGQKALKKVAKRCIAVGAEVSYVDAVPDFEGKKMSAADCRPAFIELKLETRKPWVEPVDAVEAQDDTPRPRLVFEPLADALNAAEPTWIVPGILARGATTMVYAAPKVGKTLFHLALAKALSTGGLFIGVEVPKVESLWLLSEQAAMTLGPQMRMISYTPEANHLVAYSYRQEGIGTPKDLADALLDASHSADVKPDLIVIDTLSRFVQLDDSSSYSETGNALAAVTNAFSQMPTTAAMIVHHSRKAGGEGSSGILGSTAIAGSPDILVNLRRGESNQRKMTLESRLGLGGLDDHTLTIELSLPGGAYERLHGTDYEGLQEGILSAVAAGCDKRAAIIEWMVGQGFDGASEFTISKGIKTLLAADSPDLLATGSTSSRRYTLAEA